LDLPLELSLFLSDINKELSEFSTVNDKAIPAVSLVNVIDSKFPATQKATIEKTFPVIREIFPQAKIGAGTNAFFTELNRNRPPTDDPDFLVYSINPQVHAFDNDTLVENLYAIPYSIKTAREFSKGKPVNISPISFKMRWNPNATGEEIIPEDQLPDAVDQRQMSLFGANWLVGLVNNCMSEKPHALSFFETVGLKGIMQSSSPLYTDQFLAPSRMLYPVYYVFRTILENKTGHFFRVDASHPRDFSGLAWGKGRPETLFLVNFTPSALKITLSKPFQKGTMLRINENTFDAIMFDPDKINSLDVDHSGSYLEMLPYEIVKIRIN
jgi:hypothetical protein